MRRIHHRATWLLAAAMVLLSVSLVFGDSYLNRQVKVIRHTGRPLVGKVIAETDSTITIKLGYGEVTVKRSDIKEIIDAQAVIDEHKARFETCKTGEEFYQLALWAEAQQLDRKLIRADMEKAIEVDKDHEKAREWLGYKKSVNERGGIEWIYVGEKRERDKIDEAISSERDAIKERPWEEYEIVLKFPDGNPVYEIHTNCPEDIARQYGEFMVKLKTGLTKLVGSLDLSKPVAWQNHGLGKVFICNSQKLFMEITGQSSGVGGFYTPSIFPPAEDSRCIVAFHGTFGFSGDTFEVLAHEGTHQLQGRMWVGDFSARPPWLIEGLAVYFGDGHHITEDGSFVIDIPRDRLNTLRRGFSSGKYIPLKNLLVTPYQQFGGFHYSHGWGLIYWMVHSGQTLTFKGKSYNLKEVFSRFFEANLDQGVMQLWGLFGAQSREDYEALCDQMEEPWKNYINGLTPPSVGEWSKGSPKSFTSESCGFTFELPRRTKIDWKVIPEVQLGQGELVGVQDPASSMHFTIGQRANTNAETNVDRLASDLLPYLKYFYEDFKLLPEEKLTLRGRAVYALNFTGKERKTDQNDSPYPDPVRIKMYIYLVGKQYYVLTCRTKTHEWEAKKDSFTELTEGFSYIIE